MNVYALTATAALISLSLQGCGQSCSSFSPLLPSPPSAADSHISAAKTPAQLVVAELDYDPTGWRADGFRMYYRNGTEIWIANSEYGIEITPPGGGTLWGSGTADSPDKQAVYDATQRWTARRLMGRRAGG